MSINKVFERIKERKLRYLPSSLSGNSPKGDNAGDPYGSPGKNLGDTPGVDTSFQTFTFPKEADKLMKNVPNISDSPMTQIENLVKAKEFYAATKVLLDNKIAFGKNIGITLYRILEEAIKLGGFEAARDIYATNKSLLNKEQIKGLDNLIFTTWFSTTKPKENTPAKNLLDSLKVDFEKFKEKKDLDIKDSLEKFKKWTPNSNPPEVK